jgi:hypothetical protein
MWLVLVLVLPFAGPFAYDAVFHPPPRPALVPADAVPFKQGADSVWWWAACQERNAAATYDCRLFDETGGLAVSGLFVAEPRTYSDDNGSDTAGSCRPDAARRKFGQYSNGEIQAQPGCVLVPRDWSYFPVRRMKAAVTIEGGRALLAREVPMTAEDVATSSR